MKRILWITFFLGLAYLFTRFPLAAAEKVAAQYDGPTMQDLQFSLEQAVKEWGQTPADEVRVEIVPLGSCPNVGNPHISEVQRYEQTETENGFHRGFASREIPVAHFWVIRINAQCDWHRQDLDGAMTHEVGHVLIGLDYHSKDRNSVMYWAVYGNRTQKIMPQDRERLEALK